MAELRVGSSRMLLDEVRSANYNHKGGEDSGDLKVTEVPYFQESNGVSQEPKQDRGRGDNGGISVGPLKNQLKGSPLHWRFLEHHNKERAKIDRYWRDTWTKIQHQVQKQ